MADSASNSAAKPNKPPPAGPAPKPAGGTSPQPQPQAKTATANALLEQMKRLESQVVSANFVVKNTQSEIIKLQKNLPIYY